MCPLSAPRPQGHGFRSFADVGQGSGVEGFRRWKTWRLDNTPNEDKKLGLKSLGEFHATQNGVFYIKVNFCCCCCCCRCRCCCCCWGVFLKITVRLEFLPVSKWVGIFRTLACSLVTDTNKRRIGLGWITGRVRRWITTNTANLQKIYPYEKLRLWGLVTYLGHAQSSQPWNPATPNPTQSWFLGLAVSSKNAPNL